METFVLILFSNSAESGGMGGSLMFLGAFLLIMYFFMIRPQTKKAKAQQNFMAELEKGQRVVTSGGIHGRVVKVNEDSTLLVEIDSGTKIKIERAMISMDFTNPPKSDSKSESKSDSKSKSESKSDPKTEGAK